MLSHYAEDLSDVIIIHMTGDITRESLKDAEDIWNEQLKKGPEVLALDLKGVQSIDSISLNHLFNLSKKATAQEIKLIIYDASEELKKIFEIIKLERVITVMTNKKFHELYVKRM